VAGILVVVALAREIWTWAAKSVRLGLTAEFTDDTDAIRRALLRAICVIRVPSAATLVPDDAEEASFAAESPHRT
jgi:hypothetical protein